MQVFSFALNDIQGYSFIRCNISETEYAKWHSVKGNISEMACRRSKCSRNGVNETVVSKLVHR